MRRRKEVTRAQGPQQAPMAVKPPSRPIQSLLAAHCTHGTLHVLLSPLVVSCVPALGYRAMQWMHVSHQRHKRVTTHCNLSTPASLNPIHLHRLFISRHCCPQAITRCLGLGAWEPNHTQPHMRSTSCHAQPAFTNTETYCHCRRRRASPQLSQQAHRCKQLLLASKPHSGHAQSYANTPLAAACSVRACRPTAQLLQHNHGGSLLPS